MLGRVERNSNKTKIIIPSHKSYKDHNTLKKHDNLWPSLKKVTGIWRGQKGWALSGDSPLDTLGQTGSDLQKEGVILWTRLVQNVWSKRVETQVEVGEERCHPLAFLMLSQIYLTDEWLSQSAASRAHNTASDVGYCMTKAWLICWIKAWFWLLKW